MSNVWDFFNLTENALSSGGLFSGFSTDYVVITLLLQMTLLTGIAVLIANRLKHNAAARYGVLYPALISVFFLTVVSMGLQLANKPVFYFPIESDLASLEQAKEQATATDEFIFETAIAPEIELVTLEQISAYSDQQTTSSQSLLATKSPWEVILSLPPYLLAFAIWVVGFLFLTIGLLRSFHHLEILSRNSHSLPKSDQQVIREVMRQLNKQTVQIRYRQSAKVDSPMLVGLLNPLLLVPPKFVSKISRNELKGVLLHEIAHYERKDSLANFIQKVVLAVFWFHPLVHLLDKMISRAREEICDNYVLGQEKPVDYGETLLRVSMLNGANDSSFNKSALAVGMFGSEWFGGEWKLEQRIGELLNDSREVSVNLTQQTRHFVQLSIFAFAFLLAACQVGAAEAQDDVLQDQVSTLDADAVERDARERELIERAAVEEIRIETEQLEAELRDTEIVLREIQVELELETEAIRVQAEELFKEGGALAEQTEALERVVREIQLNGESLQVETSEEIIESIEQLELEGIAALAQLDAIESLGAIDSVERVQKVEKIRVLESKLRDQEMRLKDRVEQIDGIQQLDQVARDERIQELENIVRDHQQQIQQVDRDARVIEQQLREKTQQLRQRSEEMQLRLKADQISADASLTIADDQEQMVNQQSDQSTNQARYIQTQTPAEPQPSVQTRQPPQARTASTLSDSVMEAIAQIQQYLTPDDANVAADPDAAKQALDALYEEYFDSMNAFEKQTTLNFYTNYYISVEDYQEAIRTFESILTIEELRADTRLRTLKSLGQLHMTEERWVDSLAYYNEWRRIAYEEDGIVYRGLSYAYYQLEDFQSALPMWLSYMEYQTEDGVELGRSDYAYLNGLYFILEDYQNALDNTQQMIRLFDDQRDWQNLRAIYASLDTIEDVARVEQELLDAFSEEGVDPQISQARIVPADGDYLPLVAIAPQYPTRAAQRGVTGWTLVSFTVDPIGDVIPDSISVVDAEPAVIFDRASIRAAAQFKFLPRMEAGEGVAVSGVQYVFRYQLEI